MSDSKLVEEIGNIVSFLTVGRCEDIAAYVEKKYVSRNGLFDLIDAGKMHGAPAYQTLEDVKGRLRGEL